MLFYAGACEGKGEVAELAEGAGLENRCSVHPSRGFESHPLRHFPKKAFTRTVQIGLPHAERCPSWLKEHDWKSCVSFIAAPRVRIPLSPP